MEEEAPIRRGRRARRVALAVAGLLIVLLATLWLARRPIATRFVDRELARAGVPARYTLAGLGLRRQRLENVVLGDPAAPDLVADWIETQTGIGLSGPYLSGVRAGHVRISARLKDGRVSLGSLDRLLPPPSGKPFALPALRVAGQDVRIRLATPYGIVGLKLAGGGRLDDGFRGTLAAVAPRLAVGGCVVEGVRGSVRLAITDAAPTIEGPVRATGLACDTVTAAQVGIDLVAAFGPALDRARGNGRLVTGRVAVPGARLAALAGRVAFSGEAGADLHGDLDLVGSRLAASGVDAARVWARGDYAVRPGSARLAGRVGGGAVRVDAPLPSIEALAATPLAPLARQLTTALSRAARRFDVDTSAALVAAGGVRIGIGATMVRAASGARATLTPADPIADLALGWSSRGGFSRPQGTVAVAGGGLPTAHLALSQAPFAPIRGVLRMAPYRVGDAALALAPTRFAFYPVGGGRARTVATLSGPIGGGRVEGLRVPLDLRWGAGTLTVNPGCTPVAAASLRLSGLALDRPSATLCATGPALVRVAGGGVVGGARLPELRLRGTLGASPLAIDAEGARIDVAARGFAIEGLRTRLGAPERETRLNFAALDGRLDRGAVVGGFAGGTGRIGSVPLVLGEAAGGWRFADGALDVDGALVVTDAADAPRFQPMRGQGVRLRLAYNAIAATGTLVEPTTGTAVADVAIGHALGSGVGHADLAVPGITFGQGFQPELLTRLTFGVIADVRGTVAGNGRIDWNAAGVTSTGRFRTAGTDLAAAFGPVTGLAGEIVFDDLLGLATPPGQVATVKEINPGIAVNDGVVRYRLLPGTRIAVEGARWPFAGGTLTLDPTTLDFGQAVARRMTFRVERAAADRFLQQFAFDNLQATGTFDGVLPMVFDQTGGRIEQGRLTMREGGGTIAYLGDLTQKDLGFWGNLAFQSLRSLRYRNLDVTMNGPLAGEMVTEVTFSGVSQGEGAKSNFLIRRLQRLPFRFNIRIAAPFRGLLDSVQSFYDPKRLIGRNLPALLDAQNRAANKPDPVRVQPPASEKVP